VGERTCIVNDASVFPSFAEVLGSPAQLISIDVPIGLLNGPGKRKCDVEAKRMLGDRRSSVFWPPARSTLFSRTHNSASRLNKTRTGDGLSAQAFGIMPKICEVDHLMTTAIQERVREVHPELCFWALNGGVSVRANKKTPEGQMERWRLLRKRLPSLARAPGLPASLRGRCGLDDYIDALACAWTAACVARGTATRIPAQPDGDGRGLRMEMWLPA